MAKPLVVSLPHQLGQKEAVRRIQTGLADVRQKYSALITVDEETWADNRVTLRLRAVGQSAAAVVDILDDHLRLEVTLPWLLAKISEKLLPTIQREATLMIEKKPAS
jgi:hypothetical protein